MTESIGPLNHEIPVYSRMSNGDVTVPHHIDMIDLPPEESIPRELCETHVAEDVIVDLLDDFVLGSCHFPKKDEEQLIRTVFICPGPSSMEKCRMKLLQADSNGTVITELQAL